MQKRQKVSTSSKNLKKLVISSNVWKFGATKANGENAADIVAKWPSGTVWAVRVQKTLKDREEFNPDIPRATAVIAIRAGGDDTEFYSARTGRRLTTPGTRVPQKAHYRSGDDTKFYPARTGRRLTTPGVHARQKNHYISSDDTKLYPARTRRKSTALGVHARQKNHYISSDDTKLYPARTGQARTGH